MKFLKKHLYNIVNKFVISFKAYDRKQRQNLLISRLKSVGSNLKLSNTFDVLNPQFIEIKNGFSANDRCRIEAIDNYAGISYTPKIIIGNNVNFNFNIHIGCIEKITIGDNCLFGSNILISDHLHGNTNECDTRIPVIKRNLVSKGPISIENNVWVGDGAVILGGVTIGSNAIIGANSVVTKNIPPNSVCGGIPAKHIKFLKNEV